MKHTPTPWINVLIHPTTILGKGQMGNQCVEIRANNGLGRVVINDLAAANARHIVACVNACANINPAAIQGAVKALKDAYHAMDDWQFCLSDVVGVSMIRGALVESRHQCAKAIEALAAKEETQ